MESVETRQQNDSRMQHDKKRRTITALRPFIPAKNFAVSNTFYAALGFEPHPLGPQLAEMRLGEHSFLLRHQDYHVAESAGNFVMHVLVEDLDAWWRHIDTLDLASRFGVPEPRAPKLESWGLRVAYVIDPCGVLWHFAARPSTRA